MTDLSSSKQASASVSEANQEIEITPVDLADAIHAALAADDPDAMIDDWGIDERTVIDGKFDLERVAKRILTALKGRSLSA
jgi:hypothetical protein